MSWIQGHNFLRWHVIDGKQKKGPFTAQEIWEKLQRGEVAFETVVVREGSVLRRRIIDVPELRGEENANGEPRLVKEWEKTNASSLSLSSKGMRTSVAGGNFLEKNATATRVGASRAKSFEPQPVSSQPVSSQPEWNFGGPVREDAATEAVVANENGPEFSMRPLRDSQRDSLGFAALSPMSVPSSQLKSAPLPDVPLSPASLAPEEQLFRQTTKAEHSRKTASDDLPTMAASVISQQDSQSLPDFLLNVHSEPSPTRRHSPVFSAEPARMSDPETPVKRRANSPRRTAPSQARHNPKSQRKNRATSSRRGTYPDLMTLVFWGLCLATLLMLLTFSALIWARKHGGMGSLKEKILEHIAPVPVVVEEVAQRVPQPEAPRAESPPALTTPQPMALSTVKSGPAAGKRPTLPVAVSRGVKTVAPAAPVAAPSARTATGASKASALPPARALPKPAATPVSKPRPVSTVRAPAASKPRLPAGWPAAAESAPQLNKKMPGLVTAFPVRLAELPPSCAPCRLKGTLPDGTKLLFLSPGVHPWTAAGVAKGSGIAVKGSLLKKENGEYWIFVQAVAKP